MMRVIYNPKTFRQMLKESKKYKDLLYTLEGKFALVISAVFTYLFSVFILNKASDDINTLLMNISLAFIPCLVGFLGLVLSGFAFVSGTISLKATENLYKLNKINTITNILFTFYFLGFITGIDIVLYVGLLLCALTEIGINSVFTFFYCFALVYLTLFIIFYSIGLFDTCINVFFVNFSYNQNEDDINNKKTATNNQWVSTKDKNYPDERERHDGPGGE